MIGVLIVDDDYRVAQVHADFVARMPDMRVVGQAHTAGAALDAVVKHRPDLVLLDIYLPDASGLELLQRLRRHDHSPDVLLLTAARDMPTVRQAMRAGALHYLIKPVDFGTLHQRLTAYAELHERRRVEGDIDQGEVDRLFGLMRRGDTVAAGLPKGRSSPTAERIVGGAAIFRRQLVGRRGGRARRHQPRDRAALSLLARACRGRPARAQLRLHRPARAPLPARDPVASRPKGSIPANGASSARPAGPARRSALRGREKPPRHQPLEGPPDVCPRMGSIGRRRGRAAALRPQGRRPRPAGAVAADRGAMVGRLDRSGAGLHRRPRRLRRRRPGRRVRHGVPDREEPVARQPVRLRRPAGVLRRARRLAASRARLGHRRRHRPPRGLRAARRRRARCVPRDRLRVRRTARAHRHQARAPRRRRARRRADAHDEGAAPLHRDRPYDGERFVSSEAGRRVATPLLACLLLVAAFDVLFAIDSVPAIFAVSRDTFVVFAANAFSLLGMTSLYFLLRGMMDRFHYLNYGLALILTFVGAKMLLSDVWHVPTWLSLAVIVGCLAATVGVSLLRPSEPELEAA